MTKVVRIVRRGSIKKTRHNTRQERAAGEMCQPYYKYTGVHNRQEETS